MSEYSIGTECADTTEQSDSSVPQTETSAANTAERPDVSGESSEPPPDDGSDADGQQCESDAGNDAQSQADVGENRQSDDSASCESTADQQVPVGEQVSSQDATASSRTPGDAPSADAATAQEASTGAGDGAGVPSAEHGDQPPAGEVRFGVNAGDPEPGQMTRWYSELSDADRAALRDPATEVTVTATASRTGTDSHNQALSQARAESVKQWLVNEGGVTASISTRALGENPARDRGAPDRVENPADRAARIAITPCPQPAGRTDQAPAASEHGVAVSSRPSASDAVPGTGAQGPSGPESRTEGLAGSERSTATADGDNRTLLDGPAGVALRPIAEAIAAGAAAAAAAAAASLGAGLTPIPEGVVIERLPPGPAWPGERMHIGEPPLPEGTDKIVDRPNVRTAGPEASATLGEGLNATGERAPGPGYEAHHIVPENAGPEWLRERMQEAGIKINDPRNGVWLPRSSQVPNEYGRMVHDQVHAQNSEPYLSELCQRLEDKHGAEFVAELDKIKAELAEGRFIFGPAGATAAREPGGGAEQAETGAPAKTASDNAAAREGDRVPAGPSETGAQLGEGRTGKPAIQEAARPTAAEPAAAATPGETTPATTAQGGPAETGGTVARSEETAAMAKGAGKSPSAISGVFSFGFNLAAALLHEKAIAAERRDTGYAPVTWRDAVLLRMSGEGRLDVEKWREHVRDAVAGKQPGDTLVVSWEVFKPDSVFGSIYSEQRDVTYQKQADGNWAVKVPEGGHSVGGDAYWGDGRHIPDLDVILHGSSWDASCEVSQNCA